MNIKIIFTILLAFFATGFQSNLEAMFRSSQVLHQAFRGNGVINRPACMQAKKAYTLDCKQALQDENQGIHDYNPERDESFIAAIAIKNISKLTSDATKENELQMFELQVLSALNNERTISKVYLFDGKAVGFINYTIAQPLYTKLIPYSFGPHATIDHLAIDDEYQGNGFGTVLLKYALSDCENQSVACIKLKTTEHDFNNSGLGKYYKKFGFTFSRGTKYSPEACTLYTKQLKPHPIILLSNAAYEWLRQLRE